MLSSLYDKTGILDGIRLNSVCPINSQYNSRTAYIAYRPTRCVTA